MEKEILSSENIKVGITLGDINGIGPEIIIKALKDNRILSDITPVIYGSSKVISFYKKCSKSTNSVTKIAEPELTFKTKKSIL